MSKLRIILLTLILVLAIFLAGFIVWAEMPLGPMPEALAALQTDSAVRVQTQPWLEFWPQDTSPVSGIIIYPGGRVDPRSYAPTARALAEEGYLAVITPMPLNLAVFDSGAAADVVAAYPEIASWVVGGHSLGGTMAATFAGANADTVDGLALWASYPADDALATRTELDVLSIYATNDGVSSLSEIEASRADLPPQTRWVEIAGGNHAQFGWYGVQPGDGQATISRPDQQAQIVAATADLLERLTAAEAGR